MDRRFFRSGEFVFAFVLSLLLVSVGSVVYAETLSPEFRSHGDVCRNPLLAGAPHLVSTDSRTEGNRWVRTFDYEPANMTLARVHACVGPGSIVIRPNDEPLLHVEIVVDAAGGPAMDSFAETDVQFRLAREGDAWSLGVWQTRAPEFRSGIFRTSASDVSITILTPSSRVGTLGAFGTAALVEVSGLHAVDGRLDAVAGGLRVVDSSFDTLEVGTVAGSLDATRLSIGSQASFEATSGSLVASFASFGNATVSASVTAGEILFEIPLEDPYGYRLLAHTTAGSIDFDVGPTEFSDRGDQGGGERHEVRTAEFSQRLHQVLFDLETVAGDVTVRGV